MRKYFVGAIFGFLLSISVTVYGEEVKSLVGEVIQGQFPVKVNGEELTNKAIVVDGTSYLPVREFGEKLGMEVKFDADLGIELSKKVTTQPVTEIPNNQVTEPQITVEALNTEIEGYSSQIATLEWQIPRAKKENIPLIESKINELKAKIAELEKQKAELTN